MLLLQPCRPRRSSIETTVDCEGWFSKKTLAMSGARGIQGPQVTANMVAKMRVALDIQWSSDE